MERGGLTLLAVAGGMNSYRGPSTADKEPTPPSRRGSRAKCYEPRPWTFDDDQFLRIRWRLAGISPIARDLRRSPQDVGARALELGLERGVSSGPDLKRPWTANQDELLKLQWPTATVSRIARDLCRTQSAIRDRAMKLGLKRRQTSDRRQLLAD